MKHLPFSASHLRALLATAAACATLGSQAQEAQSPCGPVAIPGHYGPFDYVTEQPRLEIVERFHFTPKVEALINGESGYLGGDLSYTLNASPNHHRALAALIAFSVREKTSHPPYMRMSTDCYFDRAIRFRPQDTVVRMLFAVYLGGQKRTKDALTQLGFASEYAGDNALTHHNIGMTYLDLGEPALALREAHLARKYGYPGTRLEERLKAAGQWKDPTE